MKVLQNVGIYPSYSARLAKLAPTGSSHQAIVDEFRRDGFESCHVLKGALEADPDFFLALGNHAPAQAAWARENGLPRDAEPTDILLAQLEQHRAEVFYNLDPVRFDDRMLARLPSCVKRTIAWSAAPTPHNRFQRYDLVVNNFPGILKRYEALGCRTAYFFPSIAPARPTPRRWQIDQSMCCSSVATAATICAVMGSSRPWRELRRRSRSPTISTWAASTCSRNCR